jgi:hypothetical protein
MNSDEKLEAEMEKITASGKGMGSLLTSGCVVAIVRSSLEAVLARVMMEMHGMRASPTPLLGCYQPQMLADFQSR